MMLHVDNNIIKYNINVFQGHGCYEVKQENWGMIKCFGTEFFKRVDNFVTGSAIFGNNYLFMYIFTLCSKVQGIHINIFFY